MCSPFNCIPFRRPIYLPSPPLVKLGLFITVAFGIYWSRETRCVLDRRFSDFWCCLCAFLQKSVNATPPPPLFPSPFFLFRQDLTCCYLPVPVKTNTQPSSYTVNFQVFSDSLFPFFFSFDCIFLTAYLNFSATQYRRLFGQ